MSRFLPTLLALTMLAGAWAASASAAELRVSDGTVVVEDGTAYVEVDVAWRLSWRNETNWDAAWIFAKANADGATHLKLVPGSGQTIDVYGIEMVYVPGGPFEAGDPAGAGYYGVMDLGGNMAEQVVTLGHPQGRAFRGTHGDGQLSPTARATNPDWHADADTLFFARRGAGWTSHPNHARTADRFGAFSDAGRARSYASGFRAVRTAPE